MNSYSFKRVLLFSIGLIICTVPVLSAIILYFPIWKEKISTNLGRERRGRGKKEVFGVLYTSIAPAWYPGPRNGEKG